MTTSNCGIFYKIHVLHKYNYCVLQQSVQITRFHIAYQRGIWLAPNSICVNKLKAKLAWYSVI